MTRKLMTDRIIYSQSVFNLIIVNSIMSSLISRLLILSLFFISVVLVFSEPIDERKKDDQEKLPEVLDYGHYVDKYRKRYNPIQTVNRAKVFFGRTLRIFQHNILFAKKDKDYFLSQNQFTDMSPEELKKNSIDEISDLAPVAESKTNPDLPADRCLSVKKLNRRKTETESQSSLYGRANEIKKNNIEEKPVLNSIQAEEVQDMRNMLDYLKEIPELAQKVSSMVDLKSKLNDNAKEFTKNNQVEYKKIVHSDNKNYDHQLITSYGSNRDSNKDIPYRNFARYLMEGSDFAYDLIPYPDEPELSDYNSDNKFSLSNLFDSVVYVYDYLTEDSDEKENDDDDEDGIDNNNGKRDEKATDKDDPMDIDEKPQEENKKIEIIYEVDWRRTGCITPPKSQMSCDSCYAFTVLSMMEYIYCSQFKELTDFSPQYVVDCGGKSQLSGCRGGKLSNVGRFIRDYGIELNTMYPYNGKENTCPYDKEMDGKKKNGYLRPQITKWQSFNSMADWYRWLKKSPLLVGINMPSDFLAYGGGVHDGQDCIPNMTHAMLLVGTGIEDGKSFWLFKNSYSDEWGEVGYFRLSKSAPLRCFSSVFVVRAEFSKAEN